MTVKRLVAFLVLVLAGAATSLRPAAQTHGECGDLMVGGGGTEDSAMGWALLMVNPACEWGGIGLQTWVTVELYTPMGSDSGAGETSAGAEVSLQPGESGTAQVYGTAYGSTIYGGLQPLYDQTSFPVEGPPPPGGGGGGGGGGSPPEYSASGLVFIDLNENGAPDGNDYPLSGTVVYLTDAADTYVIDTFTTDGSGGYYFEGLVEGTYRVKHPEPSGYFRTTDDSLPFNVPPDFSYAFGIAPLPPQCSVSGIVFIDANENGIYEEGVDSPLPGTMVSLTDWADSYVIGTDTTNSSGAYQFEGLVEGNYRVKHPAPSGFVATTDESVPFSACEFEQDFGVAEEQPPPPAMMLRLFLDVPPYDFMQGNPQSEDGIYLPGANENGTSVPVSEIQTGQQLRVYAAFVDQANPNQILAPPPGVTVTFTLDDVSSWEGYAMNQGTGTDPDFAFQGSAQNVGFTGSLAQVILLCKDYGGSVTVDASASNGMSAVALHLPNDTNNNWLPDGGWQATTGTGVESVPDDVADPWSDSDSDIGPIGSPVPPADHPLTQGWYGDGLIRFHEYRGFVVQGTHIRTDPRRLDIFISHNVINTEASPPELLSDALDFASSSLNQFRITLHELYDQEQGFPAEYVPQGVVVNVNVGTGGPVIPGYPSSESFQSALRIVNGTPTGVYGATTPLACLPTGTSPSQGGVIPSTVGSMEVNVVKLFADGNGLPTFTTEKILNEVRKTAAHEIGHGIHISHRPHDANECPDSATLGSSASVMNNATQLNGQDASYPGSQYNAIDIQQIRLHLRPNP